MKVIDVLSVRIVVFLFVLIVQLSPTPTTGASTRHHHRRHYRGYRQETLNRDAGSSPNDATPWPSNCSHCSARLAKRDYRLASIKNEILRKLHLSSPPNITGRRLPDIPPLRDLMGDDMVRDAPQNDGLGGDDFHATTMKIMLFPTPDPPVDHPGACQFRFSSDLDKDEIHRATLGVYVRRTATTDWTTYLLVYAVVDRNTHVRQMIGRRPIHLRPGSTGAWHQFRITREVRAWLDDPTSNNGLIIEATDDRGVPVVVVQTTRPEEESFKPYLEIQVQEQASSRSKRNLNLDCDEYSAEERCCRYPLVVDFESFGWDFVIVPQRYSAYYCAGECPFLYYQQYAHSHVVQQQRQRQQQQQGGNVAASTVDSGGPCCSPRRVSSISMLYYDNYNNIVYGVLPGMVVEQCGCS